VCHALTNRKRPCRAHGHTNTVKVETIYREPQEVYYTGLCTRHVRALNNGGLMIWRWDADMNLDPTAVRLSLKPVTKED
jgi:hypothetical protein